MTDETPSHTQQGQIERARRLREQIEKLKSGKPDGESDGQSIREQVEKRARKSRQSSR